MSPETIKIYSTPGCGWAVRNYAALIEKGVPFTIVMAKDADRQKTPDFIALSPYDRTPVLTADGEAVWDSLQINFFVDEQYPDPPLMPGTPLERARARLWMRHCDHELFPKISGLKGPPDAETGVHVAAGLQQLVECGLVHNEAGDLWMGARIGLVDMCYATLFDTLDVLLEMTGPEWLTVPDRLLRWRDAIRAHPTMQEADGIPGSLSFDSVTKTIGPGRGEAVADTA